MMVLLTLAALAHAAPQIQPVGLLPAASDQVESGEVWLGLFPDGDGWQVREATMQVATLPEGSGRWEGLHDVWVTCSPVCGVDAQPLVVMRGIPGLRPGPVPAAPGDAPPLQTGVDASSVLWSGDLDGDGVLDFVLSASTGGELQTSVVLSNLETGWAVAARHTASKG